MKKQIRHPRANLASLSFDWARRHSLFTAGATLVLFLAVFQLPFLQTGDVWAEAYMEYLPKAFLGWREVVMPSWEGYVTFLPSFFTKIFVALGGPLGVIDIYFRLVTVAFAVGSIALAVYVSRSLIPALWQRIIFGIALLLPLWHISAFSFINVWYIGFVPLIVVCLSPGKLNWWRQALYTVGGVALAFTKPSVLLLPFVVHRAIITKEYISNGILFTAGAFQTYFLFFASSNGSRSVSTSILQTAQAMYVGSGTELLKLFHIAPNDLLVFLANLVLVGIIGLLLWRRGWQVALLLAFGFAFSVYAYVLAPGAAPQTEIATAATVFADTFKIQRELLIYLFIILACALLLPDAWSLLQRIRPRQWRVAVSAGALLIVAGLGVLMYRPIDTTSFAVAASIDAFRSDLTQHTPTCMPVAPTPAWGPGTNWYFSRHGGCSYSNGDEQIDYADLTTSLADPYQFTVLPPTSQHSVMAVMLPVRLTQPANRAYFYLRDITTGTVFAAQNVPSRSDTQFIVFNTAALPPSEAYEFELTSTTDAYSGSFAGSDTPAHIPYFMVKPAAFVPPH